MELELGLQDQTWFCMICHVTCMALGCSDLTGLCCIAGAYLGSLIGNWAREVIGPIFLFLNCFLLLYLYYICNN